MFERRQGWPSARTSRHLVLAAAVVLIAVALAACGDSASESPLEASATPRPIDTSLATLGAPIYAASCGSCHGANGEGEPDWKVRLADGTLPAPPHDASGHSWHHADGLLFRIVRDGCAAYSSGGACRMPAFGGTLDDEEIVAVIEHLRSLWGEQDRVFQEQVTRNDPFPSR